MLVTHVHSDIYMHHTKAATSLGCKFFRSFITLSLKIQTQETSGDHQSQQHLQQWMSVQNVTSSLVALFQSGWTQWWINSSAKNVIFGGYKYISWNSSGLKCSSSEIFEQRLFHDCSLRCLKLLNFLMTFTSKCCSKNWHINDRKQSQIPRFLRKSPAHTWLYKYSV